MSNSEKNNINRAIEEGAFDSNSNNHSNNSNNKSGTAKSGSGCSKSACSNGSISNSDSTIDERVLVDPKLLFIGAKIGEGAHGKVYEGRYGDRIVAIKVLNRGRDAEERVALEGRFAREVNMMSRVKHDNLVKVDCLLQDLNLIDVLVDYFKFITFFLQFIGACKDPLMVIVSELLPGMSLRKYLGSIRPNQLDLHLALNFALDIAKAMDCLHANGIIHRDLKPDNLLLTANQKSVKLADFGLAREETVTEMMTAETGTYRWMAPELYSTVTLRQGEKKHYNNKVDVYSFGIVLWELVTNRMPFEGMSNLQAAYAAAFKQERPNLSEEISPELAFIIQSCWVEDPNMRPSFDQIIRMLNTFLFTLPPPPDPSPEERDAAEDAAAASNGTMNELSARSRRKFSFLRQIFAAKKTKNSQ
ncbi:serine/threonine-protein kinase HT1 isoform X1 [Cynara cardunculus var. scolymus]|uniref:serine/threonine-protein kinase HT1 isoform X1 n=1 Tax=Cynara cardunculus var. scolymus TaxID=59895 RepID=UPI000D629A9F|nr:serine/threonine-protein kinase HT1 isoform X1 [Cynara cardunculus var. scolymus]XP_024981772.1 serine/threonine-protein kinase HT1 isoform X1 [Cynara cardunculus var. scolymus]